MFRTLRPRPCTVAVRPRGWRTEIKQSGLIDTYDAAVVTRGDDGKVKIVKKHERPTRQGASGGLGIGLVGGALIAVFPAVALGAGLLVGDTGGAGLGALAGHVAAGISRSDLKDIGELLDQGKSGLFVVAATDLEARVDEALQRAAKVTKKQLRADEKNLEKEIDARAEDVTAVDASPVRGSPVALRGVIRYSTISR